MARKSRDGRSARKRGLPSRRSLSQMMGRATEALSAGRYFEAERTADEALHAALIVGDFDLVARIAMPLEEARRQRRLLAADAGRLVSVDDEETAAGIEQSELEPGCYIVSPPLVGADARAISERGFHQNVPVIAFAVEPLTQLRMRPVVVVGPETIRTRITEPDEITPAWCVEVIDHLTQAALAVVDTTRSPDRQLSDLVDLLDTLPESEGLHQRIAQVAREAARDEVAADAESSDSIDSRT